MDLRITVPREYNSIKNKLYCIIRCIFLATAGAADLVFAAVPDVEQTSVDLEICALRIRNVGDGLPCMQHKNAITITELSKSSIDRFSIRAHVQFL